MIQFHMKTVGTEEKKGFYWLIQKQMQLIGVIKGR